MAKPADGTPVDGGHALGAKCVAYWPMTEGTGSTCYEGVSGRTATFGTGMTWSTEAGEPCIALSGASTQGASGTGIALGGGTGLTVIVRYRISADQSGNFYWQSGSSGSTRQAMHLADQFSEQSPFNLYGDDFVFNWTGGKQLNVVHEVAFTLSSTGSGILYLDGVQQGSAHAYGGGFAGTSNWYLGYTPINSAYFLGKLIHAAVFNSVLSSAEIGTFYGDPYALFVAGPPPQLLTPDGDASVGAWTTDAGGTTNLYQRIDETPTPSDADYIRSVAGPAAAAVEVTRAAARDPASSTDHTVSVRALIDAAVGGAMTLTTDLLQSGSPLSTPATWDDTLTATAQTFDHVLSSGQADAITDYADLSLRFTADQAVGATPTFTGAGTATFTATNGAAIPSASPPNGAVGDLLVLVLSRNDNGAAPAAPTGWTNHATLTGVNGSAQSVGVYYKYATSATGTSDATGTITFGTSTVVRGAVVLRFAGTVGTGDPTDARSRLTVASTATTVGSTNITSTTANTLGVFIPVAVGVRGSNGTAITNWAGSTLAVQTSTLGTDLTFGYATRAFAAAGSYLTPGITWAVNTTTGAATGLLLAIEPVAAGSRARVTWAQAEVPAAPPGVFLSAPTGSATGAGQAATVGVGIGLTGVLATATGAGRTAAAGLGVGLTGVTAAATGAGQAAARSAGSTLAGATATATGAGQTAASGAGLSLSATTATATGAGQTATGGVGATLAAAGATATGAGQTGTRAFGSTLAAAAGSATGAGQPATGSAGSSVTLTGVAATATGAGQTATSGAGLSLAGATGSATGAGQAATGAVGSTLAAAAASATAAGVAASASTTAGLTLSATTATATGAGQTAARSAGSVLAATTATATGAGQAATSGAGLTLAGTAAAATGAGQTAAVGLGRDLTALAATATGAGQAGALAVGSVLAAATGSATGTGRTAAATVTGGVSLTALSATATGAGQAGTAAAGSVLAGATAAATGAGQTATASAGTGLTLSGATATATGAGRTAAATATSSVSVGAAAASATGTGGAAAALVGSVLAAVRATATGTGQPGARQLGAAWAALAAAAAAQAQAGSAAAQATVSVFALAAAAVAQALDARLLAVPQTAYGTATLREATASGRAVAPATASTTGTVRAASAAGATVRDTL